MKRTKFLAITTVLIAVIAVIGAASMTTALKGGVKPLKGVYVSGGDKKMYVIDPDTMTVITSKYVGQTSTWPSNQYPGDKYIWLPGGGTQGLTVINSKNLEVACATGYGSNWVEVTPDNQYAMVTTLGTDTISKWNADISELGCPSEPIAEKVYDTTEHDGPCDMTISPDGQDMWIPDIFGGITLGVGKDSITGIKVNDLNNQVIYYMPRCRDDTPVRSYMSTISPDPEYPYVFVENQESLLWSNSGTESIIDISDFYNPKEVVRLVQKQVLEDMANKCPNAALGEDGNYYLPNGAQIKDGFGSGPRSDEFVPGALPGGRKLNFIIFYGGKKGGAIKVVDVKTLEIVKTIRLPRACHSDTGDFTKDGKKFFVNCNFGNMVCRIDVYSLSFDGCVNIGTRTRGIIVK